MVIVLLAVSYLLVYTQRTGPGVISDRLQSAFHVSAAVLGTVASVQYLLYMMLQIPVGMSADRWGPERLLVAGIFLDGAGTVWFSHAASFPALLVGRALVGLGDALVFVNIVLILGRWCDAQVFGAMLGLVNTCGSLGAVLATVPLAVWIGTDGWRLPFRVVGLLLVVAAVVDAVCFRWLGRAKRAAVRTGTGTTAPGAADPPPVWRVLGEVVRDRHAWAAFGCHFGLMGTYIGFMSLWAVPYLMDTYQLPRSSATWFNLASFLGAMAGGPLVGRLSDRTGSRKWPYMALHGLAALAWLTLVLCSGHPPEPVAFAVMFVLGLGCGGSMLTFAVVRDHTPVSRSGATSGFANAGGFLSAVLLPVAFGWVLDAAAPSSAPGITGVHAAGSGPAWGSAFWVPFVFSLAGLLGCSLIRERPHHSGAASSLNVVEGT